MKAWALSNMVLAILIGLEGCSGGPDDTMPKPEKRQISSTVQRTPDELLVIAVTSSGGGAGDITHRLLACKLQGDHCEILASIDTNDRTAPVLEKTHRGVDLIVNQGDYVAGFRNFSRKIGTMQPGELSVRYRVENTDKNGSGEPA